MKFYFEQPDGEWIEQGEAHLHIRFRPRNLLGIVLTILAHVLVLWLILTYHREIVKVIGGEASPMVLILDEKTLKKMAEAAQPKKAPSKPTQAPKQVRPHLPTPPQIASDVPSPLQPVQPPPSAAKEEQPDMMSMVAAARARRQAQEDQAKAENEAARQGEHQMTGQEIAEANVRRSMQNAFADGTSGVFEMRHKGVREATFVFNGWKNSASNRLHRVINVDAGLGGDIDLAIVRRMIDLIRDYYSGDFFWESRRLGRTIKMSARPKDQAELEAFLMREFNFRS